MALLTQEVDPGEVGLDAKALDRLDQHFAHYVDEGRIPGYLVAVARGGRVAHLATHGHRDVAAGLPVEADTLWRIYSMTKPVTSVAALLLVEEGKLSLDDPVGRHLPAFAEPRVYVGGSGADTVTRPADGPLTVRHLMTHTAGLTFAFYHSHPVDALYRDANLESAVLPGSDLARTVDVYASLPLQFEPGTQWNYSVASNVLGRVIEVVSGQPLDEFFAERIFRPLGMTDAGFCVSGEQADRLSELYGERGRRHRAHPRPPAARPAPLPVRQRRYGGLRARRPPLHGAAAPPGRTGRHPSADPRDRGPDDVQPPPGRLRPAVLRQPPRP